METSSLPRWSYVWIHISKTGGKIWTSQTKTKVNLVECVNKRKYRKKTWNCFDRYIFKDLNNTWQIFYNKQWINTLRNLALLEVIFFLYTLRVFFQVVHTLNISWPGRNKVFFCINMYFFQVFVLKICLQCQLIFKQSSKYGLYVHGNYCHLYNACLFQYSWSTSSWNLFEMINDRLCGLYYMSSSINRNK